MSYYNSKYMPKMRLIMRQYHIYDSAVAHRKKMDGRFLDSIQEWWLFVVVEAQR